MKRSLLGILLLVSHAVLAQNIPEMQPQIGLLIDKSLEGEIDFIRQQKECEQFWAEHQNITVDRLTKAEKELYKKCEIETEGYWDAIGIGCSWYCGGGQDTNSATSYLRSQNRTTYSPKNIHDLNYKTAWVEGVDGYGIGQSVTYHFPPYNPRITELIIVNGYVKSAQAWKDNSRVKKLKIYLNKKPMAILNLADNRNEQHFKFSPLGYSDRDNEKLYKMPWWTITFEIMEVYPGDKYDDTAITEIFFDGIDVH